MQDDLLRALKMIRGQPNVGSNRLQVPMLPMGPAVQLSFAGMLPASDHAMKNDILFGLREQLLGAGAASVKVNNPISTYRVGSDLTATGFGTELDNEFMLTRDVPLNEVSAAGADVPVFLRITQSGVDTCDRSIFTAWFYVWSFGLSLAVVVGVAVLCTVLIEHRWPGALVANRMLSMLVNGALLHQ